MPTVPPPSTRTTDLARLGATDGRDRAADRRPVGDRPGAHRGAGHPPGRGRAGRCELPGECPQSRAISGAAPARSAPAANGALRAGAFVAGTLRGEHPGQHPECADHAPRPDRPAGPGPATPPRRCGMLQGDELLAGHASQLFGAPPAGRAARIMVTASTELATDRGTDERDARCRDGHPAHQLRARRSHHLASR